MESKLSPHVHDFVTQTQTLMTRTRTYWTCTHNNLEESNNFRSVFFIFCFNLSGKLLHVISVFCVFVFVVCSHIQLEFGSGLVLDSSPYFCESDSDFN